MSGPSNTTESLVSDLLLICLVSTFAVAVLSWITPIRRNQGVDLIAGPAVRRSGRTAFLDLPVEVRLLIYESFIPDIDVIYLANRHTPFNSAPAYYWRNFNRLAASHSAVRNELLDQLYRIRIVRLLRGELGSRDLYRRLTHLDRIVNLQISLGSLSELQMPHGRHIMYPLLCHRCRQLRKLTLHVNSSDKELFNAIAIATCAHLTSITGLRHWTLRPRLTLFVTVEPAPRRLSKHIGRIWAAAFTYARAQYRFRSIQVPMLLRTLEIHVTLTAGERVRLEQQWFTEPGGNLWRFVTRPGQHVGEFRMTWTDGRSDQEREDAFDTAFGP